MEEQKTQQGGVQDAVLKATPEDIEKNKTMAMISYLLFFIPLLTDAKDSPFAKFHANQSLVLLIFSFAAYTISSFLVFIIIGVLLMPIVGITSFVFFILGIVNASKGEMKELPLIGGIHILDK